MKRVSILLLAVIVGCALIFAACSSDDNSTNSGGNQTVQGDPNDPSFQYVTDEVGGEINGDFGVETDLIFAMLANTAGYDLGVSKLDGVSQALGATADDSIVSVIVFSWQFTGTKWFVFNFEAQIREIEDNDGVLDTNLLYIHGGIDSLQLKLDGVAVDSAQITSGVNGLDNRAHAGVDITGPNLLSSLSIHHHIQLVQGYQQNDSLGVANAQVDDTVTITTTENNNYCEIAINQSSTVTDLVFRFDGGDCPLGGSASTTASFNAFCTGNGGVSGLNLNGTWTVDAEIVGNMRNIVVVNGNTRWEVSEPNIGCN